MRLRQLRKSSVCLVGLLSVAYVLLRLGHGTLALPPSSGPAWQTWLSETNPATVIFAMVRFCAFVADLYLVVITFLLVAGEILHVGLLQRVALAITVPTARHFARQAVGLSLAGALTMPLLANAANASPADASPADAPSEVPTMRHLAPGDPIPTFPETTTTIKVPNTVQQSGKQSVSTQSGVASPPFAAHTHLVMTGENLWTIADAELTASLGRRPNTEEVRAYWLKVIERNRTVLEEPSKPGLIFPGQVISFPESA